MVGGDKPTSFADAFLHFGFPEVLQTPLLVLVDASVDDDPATLADLPFDTFQQAVVGSLFLEDGTPPSLMQQAHCYKFFKAVTRMFSSTSSSSSSGLNPPPVTPVTVQVADQSNKIPMRDWVDQTLVNDYFTMLSDEELAGLRKRFYDAIWGSSAVRGTSHR